MSPRIALWFAVLCLGTTQCTPRVRDAEPTSCIEPPAIGFIAPVRVANGHSPADIRGIVLGLPDGARVEGTQIFLAGTGYGAIADTAGRFTLPHVPAGKYTVQARRIGYRSLSDSLSFGHDSVPVLMIQFQKTTCPLREIRLFDDAG